MKVFQIHKPGKKTFRTIYAPDKDEKRRLRALVPQLNLLAEQLDVHHVQHGFTESRSPLTNAKVHVGWEYTVSFDLQDFFDTVTRDHVRKAIGGNVNGISLLAQCADSGCFQDGATRQGLPTSPALANIAASPMDTEIVERFCNRKGRFDPPAVYSRYADDLTLSCHTNATVDLLLQEIPKIVEKHGFRINPSKTKVQWSGAGNRVICGVSVSDKGCAVPRSVRRRIRAGEHQSKYGLKRRTIRRLLFNARRGTRRLPLRVRLEYSLFGLKEWAKLKLPREAREPKQSIVMAAVTKAVAAVVHSPVVQKTFGYFGRKFS